MASFGVELMLCSEVSEFIAKTNDRLKAENILTNPFKDGSQLKFRLPNLLAVYIEPIYLNFPLLGILFYLPIAFYFIGWNLSWGYVPSLVFLIVSFFWSKYFYYLMLRTGLRKGGYKGSVKLLSDKETIRRLIQYGTDRSP